MGKWIATFPGTPPASVFGTTRGEGTPIIVDTVLDVPYYYKVGTGVVALNGGITNLDGGAPGDVYTGVGSVLDGGAP